MQKNESKRKSQDEQFEIFIQMRGDYLKPHLYKYLNLNRKDAKMTVEDAIKQLGEAITEKYDHMAKMADRVNFNAEAIRRLSRIEASQEKELEIVRQFSDLLDEYRVN